MRMQCSSINKNVILLAYIHTCVFADVQMLYLCMHALSYACMHTYIQTCMFAGFWICRDDLLYHVHTYIHTYIHTYMLVRRFLDLPRWSTLSYVWFLLSTRSGTLRRAIDGLSSLSRYACALYLYIKILAFYTLCTLRRATDGLSSLSRCTCAVFVYITWISFFLV
jgi:hypothetical protein